MHASSREQRTIRSGRSEEIHQKVDGAKSGRLIILGIKKTFRLTRKSAGLSLFLYAEINDRGCQCGMTWGELGWTIEDNAAINTGIRMMGAKKYKTYRVYSKDLAFSVLQHVEKVGTNRTVRGRACTAERDRPTPRFGKCNQSLALKMLPNLFVA